MKGSCQLFWLFAFGLRSHLLEHTNRKFSVISDEKKKNTTIDWTAMYLKERRPLAKYKTFIIKYKARKL